MRPSEEEYDAALERNRKAFEAMRLELCKEHEGEFVVIHDGKVLVHYLGWASRWRRGGIDSSRTPAR